MATTTTRRGARALRLVRRGLVAFVAVALVAALVGFLSLRSAWGHDWARRRLEAALTGAIDGRVTIGALDGPLLGTPTLRDLAITDASGRVLVRVATARVDYALWPLLTSGGVHLRSVEITGADVRLERDGGGSWNLARLVARRDGGAAEAGTRPAAARLVIDRVDLLGGRVVVDAGGTRSTWHDVAGRVDDLRLNDGRLELPVKALGARWVEGERELSFVGRVDADAQQTRVTIEQLLLGASSATGAPISLGQDGSIDARVTVQLGAADVRELLPRLPLALQRGAAVTTVLTRAQAGAPLLVELGATLAGQPIRGDAKLTVVDGRATGTAQLQSGDAFAMAAGAVRLDTWPIVFDNVHLHTRTRRVAQGDWALARSKMDVTVNGSWPALAVVGTLKAEQLARGTLVAGSARATFAATGVPAAPGGSADLELDDVTSGGARVGPVRAKLDAPAGATWIEAVIHAGTARSAYALDAVLSVGVRDPRAVVVRVGGARLRTRGVQWTASRGELAWQRDGSAATVRGLTLASAGARVDVEGALGPTPGLPGIRVRATVVDLGRMRAALASDRLPMAGRATLDAHVTGAWSAPAVSFSLDTRDLITRPGAARLAGNVSGRLGGGRGSLIARLTGDGATLEARVDARVPTILWDAAAWRRLHVRDVAQARLHARNLSLVRLPAAFGVPGTIGRVTRVDAELSRRGGRTTGRASARLRGLRPAAATRSVDAELDLRLDDDLLSVAATGQNDALGRLELRAEATVPREIWDARAWRRPGATRLRSGELELADLDLAEAYRFAGLGTPPIAGHIGGSLRLGDAGLVTSAGSAQGPLGNATWTLAAIAPTDPFAVAAWHGLDDRALRSARLDVRGVELAPLVDRVRPGLVTAGLLDGSLTIAPPTPGQPAPPAVITLSFRAVKTRHTRRHGAGTARLELGETDTRAHAEATLGELPLVHGALALALGRTTLRSRGPRGFARALVLARASGDAHVDALPAQVVADELELHQRLGGTLHADVTLTGSLAAPLVVGRIDAEGARVDTVGFSALTATWRVETSGRVTLEAEAQQADGGSLHLDATTGTAPGAAVDVSLSARRFSISVLGVLARRETDLVLDADGHLDAEVRATGQTSAPSLEGHAEVTQGRLRVARGLPTLTGVGVTATFTGRRVAVRATGQAGRGSLAVSADLGLDGWAVATADGAINAKWLPVTAGQRVITTDLSARYSAKHTKAGWDVDASVRDALLRFPRDPSQKFDLAPLADVTFVDARARRQDRGRAEPLRLHVVAPATLKVESKDAGVRATLHADLTIAIVDGETSVDGQLRAVGEPGQIVLFDRRYWITEGVATFQRTLDPKIDLRLVRDFGSVTITITISGTMRRHKIDLSADPKIYDETQLLGIMLGRNPDEHASNAFSLAQGATSAATALIWAQLGSALGGRLPIDVIAIDRGDARGNRSSVTVGKWLLEDLFVAYRHRSMGDALENANEGELEYRLGLRWILQGVYGDRGKGGVDVLWIWRY